MTRTTAAAADRSDAFQISSMQLTGARSRLRAPAAARPSSSVRSRRPSRGWATGLGRLRGRRRWRRWEDQSVSSVSLVTTRHLTFDIRPSIWPTTTIRITWRVGRRSRSANRKGTSRYGWVSARNTRYVSKWKDLTHRIGDRNVRRDDIPYCVRSATIDLTRSRLGNWQIVFARISKRNVCLLRFPTTTVWEFRLW